MSQSRGLLAVFALAVLGAGAVLLWSRSDEGTPGTPDGGPAPAAVPGTAEMQTGGVDAPETGDVRSPSRAAMAEPDLAVPAVDVERVALTGRLLRANGAAAAAVQVLHTVSGFEFGLRTTSLAPNEHKAKTGADGRFALHVPVGKDGALSLIGSGLVFAGQRERMSVPALHGPHDLGDLTVADGAVVAGVVRDTSGRPLADVQVSAQTRSAANLPMMASPLGGSQWLEKSAADGSFRIAGLPAGEYRLTTASANYLPDDQSLTLRESEQRLDLVLQLETGGSISGRVVDDLGRAVAGIKVGAYRNRDLGEGVQVKSLSRGEATVTDANGHFTLGGLSEASVQVRAWAEEYVAASRDNVALDTHDVLLEVKRYGAVEGILVDEQNQPIGGSHVSVSRRETGALADIDFVGNASVETAADGTFVLSRVAPGLVRVRAEGSGHVPASQEGINVASGETTGNIRLVGARGAVVVATVLDADGRPVEGAEVRVARADDDSMDMGGGMRLSRRIERNNDEVMIAPGQHGSLGEGTTGADGIAQIAGLPGGSVQVKATHARLAGAKPARLTLPQTGTVETTLRLQRGGLAAIATFDADRRPLGGVTFVVRGPLGGDAPGEHNGTSGADGKSQVGPLATGPYEAFVRLAPRPHNIGGAAMVVFDGARDLTDTRVQFTVVENETVAVTLQQPPLCRFSGSVSDASGPVAQARVELVKAGEGVDVPGLGGAYSAESTADGTFAIDGVPPGEYTIRFGRRGAVMPMEESLSLSGQRDVVRPLVLIGGAIKVTVFSEHDGDFLSSAKVTLRRAGGGDGAAPRREMRMVMIAVNNDGGNETTEMRTGEQSVKTDDDGVAVLQDVPPGKYALEIDHSRHMKHTTGELSVTANSTTDAGQIKLDVGGAIAGKLVDSTSERPGHALVELYEEGATDARESEPALGGSFRFTGLKPGKYRVRARPLGESAGEWGPFEEIQVERGKSVPVRVRLQ